MKNGQRIEEIVILKNESDPAADLPLALRRKARKFGAKHGNASVLQRPQGSGKREKGGLARA